MSQTVRRQAKALLGAAVAGLTALGTALADGEVTQLEWTTIALAVVATYGGVFGVGVGRSSAELLELAEQAARREQ